MDKIIYWIEEQRDVIIFAAIAIIIILCVFIFRHNLSSIPYNLFYKKHVIETIKEQQTTVKDTVSKPKKQSTPIHTEPRIVAEIPLVQLDGDEISQRDYITIDMWYNGGRNKMVDPIINRW